MLFIRNCGSSPCENNQQQNNEQRTTNNNNNNNKQNNNNNNKQNNNNNNNKNEVDTQLGEFGSDEEENSSFGTTEDPYGPNGIDTSVPLDTAPTASQPFFVKKPSMVSVQGLAT